uniref:Proton pump-interactor 1 n=1 Tax=Aegilops tauschii subsp. strangulata TaxID=200361 RepID=A0A453L5K6_AEGTS
HPTAGGELAAPDGAVGLPSSNGHASPAPVESEADGVGEVEGEGSHNSEAGPRDQGTAAAGELDGQDAATELKIDHADAGDDSAPPAVESVLNVKDGESEKGAATEVVAPEEQQDEEKNAPAESGSDNPATHAESGSIVLDSEGSGEQSKGEEIAAEIMEPGTDGSGISGVTEQHDADTSVTATDPVIHVDEGKHEHAAVTELVEQDGSNGHDHVEQIADSGTSAPEIEADGSKGQQVEALTTEPEVLDGGDCEAASKGPSEEEVVANGLGCAKDTADTSLELEGESEVAYGVVEVEDVVGKDGEGDLHDGHMVVVPSSDEEAKPPAKEGTNEAIPAEVVKEGISEQIVQDNESVEDDVSSVTHQSVNSEAPVVEPKGDHILQVEDAAGDGNTAVSDVKAVMLEMNTADSVQTPDIKCASEDRSVPLHANSSDQVEEEVNKEVSPEDAHLAQNEQLELPGTGAAAADKSDNAVVEAEPGKEMEVVEDVALHAAAASTFHNEPRSIDFIDNNYVKPDTELESCDHVQAEECNSDEISSTAVDEVISGVSMDHGTAVTDDAELRYDTGGASLSETAVDQGEAVALTDNKASVVDEVKPSSAPGSESGDVSQIGESRDLVTDCQSNNDQPDILDASTTREELVSLTEYPCLPVVSLESGVKAPHTDKATATSDETSKDTENINACNISSTEVETKSLEVEPSSVDGVVPVEHENDDEHAHKGKEKIAEDSSESPVEQPVDLESDKGNIQLMRPHKFFIVKVPKLAGDDVWAKVQDAQVHLDRLTQERDAINARKKKQKAAFDEYREKLEAARKEEGEARAAHAGKRNVLDGVRSTIGKLNQATSVEEIDELIVRKQRTMEHETISLKEEKLFIKEINDLKAQRKQACSNMGSEAEMSEAFHQKDHIHEQHKTLKKEADLLFKNLKSLEENRKKIQKSFEDERAALRKLNDDLYAANELRQQAYENWVELRGEPGKKNKYFFMYKKDRDAAGKLLSSGDIDGLQSYCNNQVEGFMEMWNKDDDFRRLYVEANQISTLRRLGTHDGRSLGPDEEPPVIPSNNYSRRPNNPSQLTVSSPNVPITTKEAAPEKSTAVVVPVEEDSFPVLPPTQTHKQAKPKAAGSGSSQKEITPAPEVVDVKQIEKEKARLAEELELARKAEELARKEEELRAQRAAAEKERLRLEQIAKAKEAEERKKKKAEKAQERAEFKARKEAEMKEKKKAKKSKKVGTTPADLASGQTNSAAIPAADTESNTPENGKDPEVPQPQPIIIKRIPKPIVRQLQPMPAPLRNKFKRRTRQYIFIGVAVALAVVALILAGRTLDLPGLSSIRF